MIDIDPVTKYRINKFFLLFIPKFLTNKLPTWLASLLVTLVPYTPINAIIFTTIFLFVYFVNPLGLGQVEIHYCRFNKPNIRISSF